MELLVRTFAQDWVDPDNPKCAQAGDVVAYKPDDWQWGPCEIRNPTFIVLRVNISELEAKGMQGVEPGDGKTNPFLRKRQFHLDLEVLRTLGYSIPDAMTARAERFPGGMDRDDYRSSPPRPVINVTVGHFRAAKRAKPPKPVDIVLGGTSNVLGN